MKLHAEKNTPFFLSVVLVLTATASVCVFALSCSGGALNYSATYYFVCCYVKDNALSAATLSGTVASYGGAGYVLEYGGAYYVTVSCYYTERDADTVCASLNRRELDCVVVTAERDDYPFRSFAARGNAELYAGNLNTLQSLSLLAYECANGLDTGSYTQAAAKAVIADVESGLNGLKNANGGNCFAGEIERLLAECSAAADGYVYSKNMRRLQIAVVDCILNIELY